MFKEQNDFLIIRFDDGSVLTEQDIIKAKLLSIVKAGSGLHPKKVEVHRGGKVFWRNQMVRDAIVDHLDEHTSHHIDRSLKKGMTVDEVHNHIHSNGNLKRRTQSGSPTNSKDHTRKHLEKLVKDGHAEKHTAKDGSVSYSRKALSKPRKTHEYKVKATGGQHESNRQHLHHTIESSKRLSKEELHDKIQTAFAEKGGLSTHGGKDNNHNLGYEVYHEGNLIQHHNVRGTKGELKYEGAKETPVNDKGKTAKATVKKPKTKKSDIDATIKKNMKSDTVVSPKKGSKKGTKGKSPKVAKSSIFDSFDEYMGSDVEDTTGEIEFVEYGFPEIDDFED